MIPKTTVYTKNKCMQCKFTKKWLDNHGVDYNIINVDDNPECVEDIKRLGYQSLPVVVIAGYPVTSWSGFRPDVLEETLG